MWYNQLPHTLLWQIRSTTEDVADTSQYGSSNTFVAPSWSWASVGHPIYIPSCVYDFPQGTLRSCATITHFHITPTNPSDVYGQVDDGYIKVRGRLRLLRCTEVRLEGLPIDSNSQLLSMSVPVNVNDQNDAPSSSVDMVFSDLRGRVSLDKASGHLQKNDEAYFLPLLFDYYADTATRVAGLHGLLLSRRACGRFVRCGVVYLIGENLAEIFEILTEGNITII